MYYTYTCTLYNVHYLHYRIFRDKLEPLGVDTDLDKTKLTESRKASEKKAVKKAYEEAILHRYTSLGFSIVEAEKMNKKTQIRLSFYITSFIPN